MCVYVHRMIYVFQISCKVPGSFILFFPAQPSRFYFHFFFLSLYYFSIKKEKKFHVVLVLQKREKKTRFEKISLNCLAGKNLFILFFKKENPKRPK